MNDATLLRTVRAGHPAWVHEPSGVVFRRIPAGHFRMGFSDEDLEVIAAIEANQDEDAGLTWYPEVAENSRPAHWVAVPTFLLAWHPLTVAQARHFLPGFDDGELAREDHESAIVYRPAVLDRMLAALPFRLPSEAEWERAARGGTQTLTSWGDVVPTENDLLDAYGDEAAIARHQNQFGVAAMGCATEVCADTFVAGYHHARGDARPFVGAGPRVTRGGAACCSPWQGCGEEGLMFPAMRGALDPEPGYGDLIVVGIRPALDWPGPPEPPAPRSHPEQLTLVDRPTDRRATS